MKILITGGAGFIGSNLIHYILKKYPTYKIVNFDMLTYAGNLENLDDFINNDNYEFIKGDICNKNDVEKAVSNNIDAIIHCAAETHVDRSILSPEVFIQTNILGTFNLLEAAKKYTVSRFHHISTDEVFGQLLPGDPAFTEETKYNPRSPYSASKASSDHLVRSYFSTYNLPITISNCSNNYGPYLFPEKLISLAITNLLEDKKIPIYGTGDQIRDWLYVTDHCNAIDLILHGGRIGETYCIGGGNQSTNMEIVHKIITYTCKISQASENFVCKSKDHAIEFIKDRPGHDFRYDIDYSKIKSELGWEPHVSLSSGLKKMILWYSENRAWWQRCKSGAYREYYERQYLL